MLTVAVARSSSGSVATCYVLPVLWMTSSLHGVGSTAHASWCIPKRRDRNSRNYCIGFNKFSLNDRDQRVVIMGCTPGLSLLYTISLLSSCDSILLHHYTDRPYSGNQRKAMVWCSSVPSVCLSLRPSQAGILPKRLNG